MLLKRMSWCSSNKEGDTRLRCLRESVSAVSPRIRNMLPRMWNCSSPVPQEV